MLIAILTCTHPEQLVFYSGRHVPVETECSKFAQIVFNFSFVVLNGTRVVVSSGNNSVADVGAS